METYRSLTGSVMLSDSECMEMPGAPIFFHLIQNKDLFIISYLLQCDFYNHVQIKTVKNIEQLFNTYSILDLRNKLTI